MGTGAQQIAIVDYGTGNLESVRRTLERIGVRSIVTADAVDILHADKLVLPGVGHFRHAMANLHKRGLLDALREAAFTKRVPVLGICLGMQLMATHSEEGDAEGLGWLDADVIRLSVPDTYRFKIPHIGWCKVRVTQPHALLEGLAEDAEFYFAHSYNVRSNHPEMVLCESEYALPFTSAIAKGNLFGVQFHPEKSHASGERLLRNFARL